MIISFINQKGGVGKTTTAINLGAGLAALGYKVLLIDFDPQANLSSGVGINNTTPSIYDVLSHVSEINDSIQKSYLDNLYVIPSNNSLSGAAVELVSLEERELFLKKNIAPIQKDFDFFFIDCPPSLGLLTINAFCAADSIIIPLQCEYFAMEGIAQLVQNIQLIQQGPNKSLSIFGIILTMFDTRTNLSREVASEIVSAFGSSVFQTIIPRNIKIAEAPSYGQSVISYDRECIGSKSYQLFAKEVITRWKNQKQTK